MSINVIINPVICTVKNKEFRSYLKGVCGGGVTKGVTRDVTFCNDVIVSNDVGNDVGNDVEQSNDVHAIDW